MPGTEQEPPIYVDTIGESIGGSLASIEEAMTRLRNTSYREASPQAWASFCGALGDLEYAASDAYKVASRR